MTDDWITLFFLKDYTHKKKDILLAVGFKENAPVTILIRFFIKKLHNYLDDYSVYRVDLITLEQFKKQFPKHFKRDMPNESFLR